MADVLHSGEIGGAAARLGIAPAATRQAPHRLAERGHIDRLANGQRVGEDDLSWRRSPRMEYTAGSRPPEPLCSWIRPAGIVAGCCAPGSP